MCCIYEPLPNIKSISSLINLETRQEIWLWYLLYLSMDFIMRVCRNLINIAYYLRATGPSLLSIWKCSQNWTHKKQCDATLYIKINPSWCVTYRKKFINIWDDEVSLFNMCGMASSKHSCHSFDLYSNWSNHLNLVRFILVYFALSL